MDSGDDYRSWQNAASMLQPFGSEESGGRPQLRMALLGSYTTSLFRPLLRLACFTSLACGLLAPSRSSAEEPKSIGFSKMADGAEANYSVAYGC